METNEIQVSRNMKSIREKFGLTQEDLASMIGVTDRTYKQIEKKPFSYPINKINKIAKAIGCNLNEFFLPVNITISENIEVKS